MIVLDFKKVKSHQDERGLDYEDLSFEAKLNIKADEYAGFIRNSVAGPINKPSAYQGEGLIVRDDTQRKVNNISSFIARTI